MNEKFTQIILYNNEHNIVSKESGADFDCSLFRGRLQELQGLTLLGLDILVADSIDAIFSGGRLHLKASLTVMDPCYNFLCNSWNLQKKIFHLLVHHFSHKI